ncbi:hypothetical protein WISP_52771 [Willisornis vidua]|uniref:RRM domain-containing protein n=1 Tax=Willisornis vidua TaxID=1566151 RepID=A0ABQ9DEJ2_9PASS|nr:hypothetical protein WISP_52771 [Willisornis vidua]
MGQNFSSVILGPDCSLPMVFIHFWGVEDVIYNLDSPLPVSSRVCFVKFQEPDSAVVAQHLTNTVFVDRALIVVPYAEGVIPDETKALSLLAPANAVAGLLPGGGLLPTPNPLSQFLESKELPCCEIPFINEGTIGGSLSEPTRIPVEDEQLVLSLWLLLELLLSILPSLPSGCLEQTSTPRHKKEKKKDKDKERSRDERERSTSKKKKSKDKEKDRDRKSESDKDVKQVTRDYDEEEQGYDSEKDKKEEKKLAEGSSPKGKEPAAEKGGPEPGRESKVNGDDHHEEDMDMSD